MNRNEGSCFLKLSEFFKRQKLPEQAETSQAGNFDCLFVCLFVGNAQRLLKTGIQNYRLELQTDAILSG